MQLLMQRRVEPKHTRKGEEARNLTKTGMRRPCTLWEHPPTHILLRGMGSLVPMEARIGHEGATPPRITQQQTTCGWYIQIMVVVLAPMPMLLPLPMRVPSLGSLFVSMLMTLLLIVLFVLLLRLFQLGTTLWALGTDASATSHRIRFKHICRRAPLQIATLAGRLR